jgi:hypothetical protein
MNKNSTAGRILIVVTILALLIVFVQTVFAGTIWTHKYDHVRIFVDRHYYTSHLDTNGRNDYGHPNLFYTLRTDEVDCSNYPMTQPRVQVYVPTPQSTLMAGTTNEERVWVKVGCALTTPTPVP